MQTPSQTDPLARTFAAWARHGRPDDLARVFEATAPGLLRVARHLAVDLADAEDLLQSTFVTAMAKAREFDPGRPLLPWLNGILQRHAQRQREHARRSPDPARVVVPAASPDPAEVADRAELDREVRLAIDRLPTADRALILLELRHGLAPAEIAEVLDRAPGTVRVQLHRARERLRRLLPAGVASSLVLGGAPLRAARGLAAVRGEVLAVGAARFAAAGSLVPVALQVFTMQVLGMKATTKGGLIAGAALLLLTVTVGAWVWSENDDGRAGMVAPRVAGAGAAPRQVAAGSGPTPTDVRTPVAEPGVGDDDAPGATRGVPVLRLKLTTWVFERPLVGVPVRVEPQDGRLPALHARIECTDEDGLAVFEGLPPGRYNVIADRSPRLEQMGAGPVDGPLVATIHGSGYPLSDEQLPFVEMPRTEDVTGYSFLDPRLVKLDLPPGAPSLELHGIVKEPDDVEEVDELIADQELPPVSDMPRFEVDERLGEHALDRLIGRVEIRDEDVFEEYSLSYGTRVKGEVRTPEGEPVAGARIGLLPPDDNEPMPLEVRSGPDGRFRIVDLQPGVRLFAYGVAGFAPGRPVEVVADGKWRILELGPAEGAVEGVVHDEAGNPIAGAMVRVGRVHPQFQVQRERTDEQGRFGPLWVDTEMVTVLVQAAGREPWAGLVVAGKERPTVVDVTLRRGWRLSGRVVDEAGEPVGSARVLARSADRPQTEALADDGGHFALECLPAGEVELRVPGVYRFRDTVLTLQGGPGEERDLEITLARAGHIDLLVTDERNVPLIDWVVRIRPTSEPSDAPEVTRRIDDQGRVSLETWPGETYRLTLQPDTRKLLEVTRKDGSMQRYLYVPSTAWLSATDRKIAGRDLGLAELPGVFETHLVVPDRFLPTARVQGRLLDAGGQPTMGELRVEFPEAGGFAALIEEDGHFDTGLLVPGPCTLRVRTLRDGVRGEFFDLDVTALGPDQRLDLGEVRPPS